MKLTNIQALKENVVLSSVIKVIPAVCLLLYLGAGVSESPRSEDGGRNGTNETRFVEDVGDQVGSPYVRAGETETGIIIIGGGGIMLLSNRKSPKKLKKKLSKKQGC